MSGNSNPLDEFTERAQALGEFIRQQRQVARLSLRKLSELADVSNPYLSQIERGLRKPSAEILQQLAKALRISAESLYIQAGILEERPESLTLERAIWDEPTLSEAQKRALVQVLRSFQAENEASATPRRQPASADSDPRRAGSPAGGTEPAPPPPRRRR